jgi:hypothetical protein
MNYNCELTHALIGSGVCPWCKQAVADGNLSTERPASATCEWNTTAMLEALDHEDVEIRCTVLTNIVLGGAQPRNALPVLRKALRDSHDRIVFVAATALTRLGDKLETHDVLDLERQADRDVCDLAVRILLLGFYDARRQLDHFRLARHRHIMWIIENAPEAAGIQPSIGLDPELEREVYERAKQLWMRQVAADEHNPTILSNAAYCFRPHDPAMSEKLLWKARSVEPENPEWSRRLGVHLAQGLSHRPGQQRREAAARAFYELERAHILETDEFRRFLALPDLAKLAVEADEREKARAYATELLDHRYALEENGPEIHYGNLVLGRLALIDGEVEEAKRHLLKSAKTVGNPLLCTDGPNMSLAKELLERGERQTVVAFLHLCANFWVSDDHRARQWADAIEHGETPDFGPNLDY